MSGHLIYLKLWVWSDFLFLRLLNWKICGGWCDVEKGVPTNQKSKLNKDVNPGRRRRWINLYHTSSGEREERSEAIFTF